MKEIAKNKQAFFDYEILETIEAGISLLGFEVKSVKSGRIQLGSSYARVQNDGLVLINADIPPYQPKNAPQDYDPKRTRTLLVTKAQVKYLRGKSDEAGLTILPLRVYTKGRLIKLELGLGRHNKKADKREVIKKRDVDRDIRRNLKI